MLQSGPTAWGFRPRTPVNGLCSRCDLGRFTYRKRAAVMRCPVIRWQGERMKRQGLRRALAGGRSTDRGRMLRRHPSRQQKDAVTLAGRGCAPWPVLWWELLLSVWLVPCGQGTFLPPPDSGEGGGEGRFRGKATAERTMPPAGRDCAPSPRYFVGVDTIFNCFKILQNTPNDKEQAS